jgi:hypothetical protein
MKYIVTNKYLSKYISCYRYINPLWALVYRYPNKYWNWYWLSSDSITTWETICQNSNMKCKWNWYCLSSNENITLDHIEKNLTLNDSMPWSWAGLSENPNITWEFITKHIDKDWSWY